MGQVKICVQCKKCGERRLVNYLTPKCPKCGSTDVEETWLRTSIKVDGFYVEKKK